MREGCQGQPLTLIDTDDTDAFCLLDAQTQEGEPGTHAQGSAVPAHSAGRAGALVSALN